MYLVTVAPSLPTEKPARIVCKDWEELLNEVDVLSNTPEVVSFLVERVKAHEPVKRD